MSLPLMKTIDKSAFRKTLPLLAIRIPQQQCNKFYKKLETTLFRMPRLKNVVSDPTDDSKRLLLLNETIHDRTLCQLPKSLSQWIFSQKDVSVVPYNQVIDYDYYSANEVLKQLLPTGVEVPTSFEQVGSLIHLNLSDVLLPYRFLIGQVLLDKIPSCKTVVNKVGKIDSVYRTFDMEVIAGENNTNVTVKERNCTFQFDYRKVYWNSRLHHEHSRLVETFKKTDIVADMFCGVGPYVIPAAKKGCMCYANDLNPDCYRFLQHNIEINHTHSNVKCFNVDAREFMDQLFHQGIPITQVIMNLPHSAEFFCDVFRNGICNTIKPTVHCYMFSNHEDPIQDSIQRIEHVLNTTLVKNSTSGRIIRDVAPRKRMTLISFQLPH